jgi:DNA modification methylase
VNKILIILGIIIGVFLLLFFLPIIWRNDIVLDKAQFATEFYKTLASIGEILLGFWLASIYLQKTQVKEFALFFQKQWHDKVKSLRESILLFETIPNNLALNVPDLIEKIKENDIGLDYLSDIISIYPDRSRLGTLGEFAYEYKALLHHNVEELQEAFRKGDVIYGRPFDKDVLQIIDILKAKLSV